MYSLSLGRITVLHM